MTLREMRIAAGLTMRQALEGYPIPEIDVPLLSKIERGVVQPPESLVQHIYARCGQEPPETGESRPAALANGFLPMETRREAHETVDKLGRRREILSVWEGEMIPREVLRRLPHTDMNSVRPRISEMKKAGILEVVDARVDPVTGKRVTAYCLTEAGQAMKRGCFVEHRIVPRDKFIRDALDPRQKERRARERYYRKHGEWIAYRRDTFAKKLHDQTRRG